MTDAVNITQNDMRKILSAASPDAALLYLYLKAGNAQNTAEADLNLNTSRLSCAAATLRQLGLLEEQRQVHIAPGERPGYSEQDVLDAMDRDTSFRGLYGEVQRLLGRSLNTAVYALVPVIGMVISTFFYLGYKLNDKDVQIMAKCNSGEISREEAEALLSRKY